MFRLENGKPNFFIGKINGIGYTDNKDKEILIEKLKKEDKDIEIIDEEVTIDEDFKKKAIALGEKQLTYSKSKFLDLLNRDIVDYNQLAKDLQKKLKEEEKNNNINMMGLIDVNNRLRKMEGGK